MAESKLYEQLSKLQQDFKHFLLANEVTETEVTEYERV